MTRLTHIGSRVEASMAAPGERRQFVEGAITRIVSSDAKAPHPLLAMSYCHMSLNWCSEAIANAVGGKCISYVGGNLCLCFLVQTGNCCCDRGCRNIAWHVF